MNKKRTILGLMIAFILAIGCAYLTNVQPSVFAFESEPQISATVNVNEAGTFTGEGYYKRGDTANLEAKMNPGYKFLSWNNMEDDSVLSTELKYSFVVEQAISIEAKWDKIAYNISFEEDMYLDGSLKDYNLTIINHTQSNGEYNYGDLTTIKLEVKTEGDRPYIYDLTTANITINVDTNNDDKNDTIEELLKNANVNSSLNPMNVTCEIINGTGETSTGLISFIITLNIKQDIVIGVNEVYMNRLEIVSGNNEIPIADVLNLVEVVDAFSQPDPTKPIYLVREDRTVTINTTKQTKVYQLISNQLMGEEAGLIYSKAYTLQYKYNTFTVTYQKIKYQVDIKTYLINLYGEKDEVDFYTIDSLKVCAGESVELKYALENKEVSVKHLEVTKGYTSSLYGYKFKGFVVNGVLDEIGENTTKTSTFTMSDVSPSDAELQLIFEYIEYGFEIKLIDSNVAEDDITYSFNYDNNQNKLIKGTIITLNASTTKYTFKGWSLTSTPEQDGYLSNDNFYQLSAFEPTSDDNTQNYVVYLDVEYNYLSVEFALDNNSIIKNLDYNQVQLDLNDTKLIFSDSENKVRTINIDYSEEDITIEGNITKISTTELGIVEIEGEVLRYTSGYTKHTSILRQEIAEGVYVYSFEKYSYLGNLQVSIVKSISVVDAGTNGAGESVVNITFNGITFNAESGANGTSGEIGQFEVVKNELFGKYILAWKQQIYFVPNEYVSLRNVTYRYNEESGVYEVNNALSNTPQNLTRDINSTAGYLKINNLLNNDIVFYQTASVDVDNYRFTSLADSTGNLLGTFAYNGYQVAVLNSTSYSKIYARYMQLTNTVTISINNMEAYDSEDIEFIVEGTSGTVQGKGEIVNAKNGEKVTIIVSQDKIKGRVTVIDKQTGEEVNRYAYKFTRFIFDGTILDDEDNNALTLSFIMGLESTTLSIEFSVVSYQLKVNYLNENNEIIDQTYANGSFKVQGKQYALGSILVDINGTTSTNSEYIFNAVALNGYYVSSAYIGADNYSLGNLITSNDEEILTTTWILNKDNFLEAIVANADGSNKVNLYIKFKVHTYNIKVYLSFADTTSTALSYPKVLMNEQEIQIQNVQEIEGDVPVTKHFAKGEDFTHSSNVIIRLQGYMLGTTILQWTDENGQQLLGAENQYTLSKISKDTTIRVVLQFVAYNLKFELIDNNGNACTNGEVTTSNKTVKLFDRVVYTVESKLGYVLKQKYNYKANGEINDNEDSIASGFEFSPANFKIEDGTTVKIYLVFALKEVKLEVANVVSGKKHYFDKYEDSELAVFELTRKRGDNIAELTEIDEYVFKTGDILTMKITTISMGLELYKVQLADINITSTSSYPYELVTEKIYDDDNNIVGMYYKLQIEFTASMISSLKDVVKLDNVLKVKTFNLTYTYNYISNEFGVQLILDYGGSTQYSNIDTPIQKPHPDNPTEQGIVFGSEMAFGYGYEGMNSGEGNNFNIDGCEFEGRKYSFVGSWFNFKGDISIFDETQGNNITINYIDIWEQIALNKYINNTKDIKVVLVLKPKINLHNYTSYSLYEGYIYQRTYIGANQGLVLTGVNPDVTVGSAFEAVVTYSSDGGVTFVEEMPINKGIYQVQIVAKITSGTDVTDVIFEEKVTYEIMPAPLTISLKTYSSDNPISKTYDNTTNMSTSTKNSLANDILLEGLFAKDSGTIYVDKDRMSAKFTGIVVNDMSSLYDIDVRDIYLLDASHKEVENYIITSGTNLTFTDIGKINPAQLQIKGFKLKKNENDQVLGKVYDGTNIVTEVIDISNLYYEGKIESDSSIIDKSKLEFYLENYTVGNKREVFIKWDKALSGADSFNYTVTYDKIYVDVYPYELSCEVEGYGVVKVVDIDKKCAIPIGAKLIVNAYEKGSAEYREIFSALETSIVDGEKLRVCYSVVLQTKGVNILIPEGLYICIPKINKVSKVMQVPDDGTSQNLDMYTQDNYIIVRAQEGRAKLGVIANTVYLPLWAIILIVMGSLLLVGGMVLAFILIRRKTRGKYSRYDKI